MGLDLFRFILKNIEYYNLVFFKKKKIVYVPSLGCLDNDNIQ